MWLKAFLELCSFGKNTLFLGVFGRREENELKQDIFFINILVFIFKLKSKFVTHKIKIYTNIDKNPYVNKLNYHVTT